MKVFKLALAILGGAAAVLAHRRQSPPSGSLVVSKNPSHGQYQTIQAAVNALSKTSTRSQRIFIEPGTYNEQVVIPALKGPLAVFGSTASTADYTHNTVTITHNLSQKNHLSDQETGTVRVMSPHVALYNVAIVNSFGEGSQAIALSAEQDQFACYGCAIHGFQDTLLSQSGRQFYSQSYITGATDFIFGQHAQTVIYKSQIGVLNKPLGYITASGRPDANDPSYYLITDSHIRAADGEKVAAGAYYLGRPWGPFARVTVQDSQLEAVVNKAGYSASGKDTSHTQLAEHHNSGPGAQGPRVAFDKQLPQRVDISTVLGSNYGGWIDANYL